ncbi:unnamed protein product [Schistosoma mattheei]|uniref:Uncharacterized protein n=2 Tax=Schistosoma TaxID=6181 RepID=A0A183Q0A7_9TREM|nr:unnamed protein product [Schistosoma mattheei]
MISGTIADWQITSSSTYPSSLVKGCEEKNARLFRTNGLAWCAKFKSSSEWLQIDLGVQALVSEYFVANQLTEPSFHYATG